MDLTGKDRFALYVHLNQQTLQGHAEERKFSKLWEALQLDEIAAKTEAGAGNIRDHSAEPAPFELAPELRDYLIGLLERPKLSWLARVLYPIAIALRALRTAEEDEEQKTRDAKRKIAPA